MTQAIQDAACLSALGEALGHGAPFSAAELSALQSLTITGARSLDGLQVCNGLTHLRIIGSEIADLTACRAMPALAHLEVIATRIGSLAGMSSCAMLERVDLLYTSLTSAADLLALKALRCGAVFGNPWDDQSWLDLRAAAEAGLLIDLPAEFDWKTNRQLWEGHGLCWGPITDMMPMVVRPGLPMLTSNAYDAIALAFIRHELNQPDFGVGKLFEEYAGLIACPDMSERTSYRTLGRIGDVRGWIAGSSLRDDDKADLSRFAGRFPTVTFYRLNQARLDIEASHDAYALPDWFLELRRTLDGWLPRPPFIPVRFGDSAHGSLSGRAFYLAQYGHGADEEAALVAAGFVNIGLAVDDPRIFLAIQLNGGDRCIYVYDVLDAGRAVHERRDPTPCFTPVSDSYFELLDRVVALLPQDKDPILAVEL